MALELWETLTEAITTYTGLSPATFFTVVALSLALYHAVFGLFGSSSSSGHHGHPRAFEEEMEPLPPPVQLGEISEDELKQYDGSDKQKPLLMAIKGQIYDVTQSRMFYGPGGPYALFTGKDASRALAKISLEDQDLTGDISGLASLELEALDDWEYKFMSKYVKVGTIKKQDVPVSDGSSPSETATATATATDREAPKEDDGTSEKPATETVETSFTGNWRKALAAQAFCPGSASSSSTTPPPEAPKEMELVNPYNYDLFDPGIDNNEANNDDFAYNYMDEDTLFGMPELLNDMYQGLGMLLPPTSWGNDHGCQFDEELESTTSDMSLWSI